jgi:2-(1,2-epoxy-1,2-dihydrophenyl)acetyl-CoA isomerase
MTAVTDVDTGSDELLADIKDGVAILTMNRPERRNALTTSMLDALARTLAQVELDDEVGCVVLTGSGDAFSAGGDVKDMAAGNAGRGWGTSIDAGTRYQQLNQLGTSGKLYRMSKPTIASIPGPAAGGGFSLALSCDLRYAPEDAVFTTAFARVGLSGDYGGTWFLTQLVGPAKAKELYYFSERFTAADAQQMGLLNGVFKAADLHSEVIRRARRLADGPRVAYRYMKENVNRAV